MPNSAISDSIYTYLFKEIYADANISIIVTTTNGIIKYINPFALKVFGYKSKELTDKKVDLLIPSFYQSITKNEYNNNTEYFFSKIVDKTSTKIAVKKDSTELLVRLNLTNYSKKGSNFFIAFLKDISERKKEISEKANFNIELEAVVKKRTKDLNAMLEKLKTSLSKQEHLLDFLRAIVKNAGAMIIATDLNGFIKLFNPEAVLNIGYTAENVIDKFTPLLFHLKSEIDEKRVLLFTELGVDKLTDFEVLVEKSTRNIHEEERYTYIRKNGSTFPVTLTISAIRDTNNCITGFMGIAVDNSVRIKAEQDLKESLKKEKDLSELKSRFVSMASHEFRTPLSTVLSSAYLIEKYIKTEDQPKREKHLHRITSSVKMLTDILNDFLSLGKIEEGKIQIRLTEFNIEEIISMVIEDMKVTLKSEQKIQYSHVGKQLVLLDASLIKHIVQNLVSNASKFSSEKGDIIVTTNQHKNSITLSVKDNGIGISIKDQQHLMERFFRGSNAENIQGTGLGLHIISKYTELLNGKITCKSELEKGTEFLLVFKTKKNCNEKDFAN